MGKHTSIGRDLRVYLTVRDAGEGLSGKRKVSIPNVISTEQLYNKISQIVSSQIVDYRGRLGLASNDACRQRYLSEVRAPKKTISSIEKPNGSIVVNPNVISYFSSVLNAHHIDPSGIGEADIYSELDNVINLALSANKKTRINPNLLEVKMKDITPSPLTAALGNKEKVVGTVLDYLVRYSGINEKVIPNEYLNSYISMTRIKTPKPILINKQEWKDYIWAALKGLHPKLSLFFEFCPPSPGNPEKTDLEMFMEIIQSEVSGPSSLSDKALNQLVLTYNILTGATLPFNEEALRKLDTMRSQLILGVSIGITLREYYNKGLVTLV